jgi:predicted small lipoprotein YifL
MRALLMGILLCLTITACGAKGPLYLPEKQYPQKKQ